MNNNEVDFNLDLVHQNFLKVQEKISLVVDLYKKEGEDLKKELKTKVLRDSYKYYSYPKTKEDKINKVQNAMFKGFNIINNSMLKISIIKSKINIYLDKNYSIPISYLVKNEPNWYLKNNDEITKLVQLELKEIRNNFKKYTSMYEQSLVKSKEVRIKNLKRQLQELETSL